MFDKLLSVYTSWNNAQAKVMKNTQWTGFYKSFKFNFISRSNINSLHYVLKLADLLLHNIMAQFPIKLNKNAVEKSLSSNARKPTICVKIFTHLRSQTHTEIFLPEKQSEMRKNILSFGPHHQFYDFYVATWLFVIAFLFCVFHIQSFSISSTLKHFHQLCVCMARMWKP